MKTFEQQIATSVLVIGTGRIRPAGGDRAGRARRRRARRRQAAQGRRAHLAGGRRDQRGAGHDGPRGHLAAARRRHAQGELPAREPAHGRRSSPEGAARGIDDLERYGMPFAREDGRPDLAALLRRAHVPPDRLRRRLHRPGDPAHADQPRRAARHSRSSTRSTSPGCSSTTTPCSARTASTSTTARAT